MIELEVNSQDLMRWSRYQDRILKATPIRLMRALNYYGDTVVRKVVDYVVDQTGMEADDVVDLIEVQKATRYDLTWAMNATAAMNQVGEDAVFDRPWESRDNSRFEQERLVKIETMNDGYDCEVCQEAALEPYTMQQIEVMQAKWAGWEGRAGPAGPASMRTNLIHPNCRCRIVPFYSSRRLPVLNRSMGAGAAPPELFSANQLANIVRQEFEEMSLEISVT